METEELNYPPVLVLDHGFVRLVGHGGGDLSVVNSARISYGTAKKVMDESDVGLIKYLMKNRHGTPFEHNMFQFHVKAPIFIFREWMRHRIGSFNELSARYTELPGEWYLPKPQNVRARIGRAGRYTFQQYTEEDAKRFIHELNIVCMNSYDIYRHWLKAGVAPEQARFFLHVNHYSEMYWTVNARSLMNFISLRAAPTAQWEIQQYAKVIVFFFNQLMPITGSAFEQAGNVAP